MNIFGKRSITEKKKNSAEIVWRLWQKGLSYVAVFVKMAFWII